jgi:hypothetical protein
MKMRPLLDRLFAMEKMDGDGVCATYLVRWTLLRLGELFAIYLHKFVGDDWSVDLHDHPKRFVSIGLRGRYTEHVPDEYEPLDTARREWCAPWIRTFPATHRHRITGPTPERPCWTLVIVGPPVRPWGFWLRGMSWIPWRRYVDGFGHSRRSC